MLFVAKSPKYRVAGSQFVAGLSLPAEAEKVAEQWREGIQARGHVKPGEWLLEVGQFDTSALDGEARERTEAVLLQAPDVRHVRMPGEVRCLRCEKWSCQDPRKVEKVAGRGGSWTCEGCRA